MSTVYESSIFMLKFHLAQEMRLGILSSAPQKQFPNRSLFMEKHQGVSMNNVTIQLGGSLTNLLR